MNCCKRQTDATTSAVARRHPSPRWRHVAAWLAWACLFSALPVAAQGQIALRNVTKQTGIAFRHTDGSSGRRYIVEPVSAGVALFDYDRDGDIDIYFLNGAPLKGTKTRVTPRNALYRNDGRWKFTDVTRRAGVGDKGYGLGVAVADYDNDGDLDMYLNNFGPNVMYRNNGDGTFSDVTKQTGTANGNRVGAGACFLDMDQDGDLDLFASNYVKFSYETHASPTLHGFPVYPSPRDYFSHPDTMYRNNGDGTFTDVGEAEEDTYEPRCCQMKRPRDSGKRPVSREAGGPQRSVETLRGQNACGQGRGSGPDRDELLYSRINA